VNNNITQKDLYAVIGELYVSNQLRANMILGANETIKQQQEEIVRLENHLEDHEHAN
jgi:hypothetical protein